MDQKELKKAYGNELENTYYKFLEELKRQKNLKNITADFIVKFGNVCGETFKDISVSQIRKFFGAVKKISVTPSFNLDSVILLKPLLAYTYSRLKKNEQSRSFKKFNDLMNECIDRVKDREDFDRFLTFFESILAYHKFYGGKD